MTQKGVKVSQQKHIMSGTSCHTTLKSSHLQPKIKINKQNKPFNSNSTSVLQIATSESKVNHIWQSNNNKSSI
jgi:hypothetical protein